MMGSIRRLRERLLERAPGHEPGPGPGHAPGRVELETGPGHARGDLGPGGATADSGVEGRLSDGDSMWDRVVEATPVAPVMGNPTLEPADAPWEVALMAGWAVDGDRGHDALQGVDLLVTGEADATEGLRVESGTPGPPLALGPTESCFTADPGRRGDRTHGLAIERDRGDWCRELNGGRGP